MFWGLLVSECIICVWFVLGIVIINKFILRLFMNLLTKWFIMLFSSAAIVWFWGDMTPQLRRKFTKLLPCIRCCVDETEVNCLVDMIDDIDCLNLFEL